MSYLYQKHLLKLLQIAACLLLTGCSDKSSLEDYSSEDITQEYNRRLQAIINGPMAELSERTTTAFAMNPRNLDSDKLDYDEDTYNSVVTELIPFAQAGEPLAEWVVGSNLLATSDHGSERYANGFVMVRSAARKGLTEAAFALSGYYLFCAISNRADSERLLRLAYLWAKEASRDDPSFKGLFDPIVSQLAPRDVDKLELEWVNWSPKSDSSSRSCESMTGRE